ncbi:MAG: hypothetical protein IKU86_02240 [Thermoguttaceae bacterium]|nr:hypothetical protein [Thermoguttaceae bacterium]
MMKQSILFGFGTALLSLGLAVGGYLTGRVARQEPAPAALPVFAASSSESDGVVLATGSFSSNVEAMYYLDSQSGRLSAALLSRSAPEFQKTFVRNVKNDLVEAANQLGVSVPTTPKFLMTTGEADVRNVGARGALSKSFVYVAEINSGFVLVYALPSANERDLAVSGGEIVLWTYARLNEGLQDAAAVGLPQQARPQNAVPAQEPRLLDSGFYRGG